MIFMQITKFRFIGLLFIIILLFLGTGICPCDVQEADKQGSAVGELKLQGKYIERLVLWRKDGRTERFDQPAETIKLPVGEYRLLESYLKGGYTCRSSRTPYNWITVAEDKPAVFKVGAPLKQTIQVQRKGRILALSYELLGVGGEKYTSRNRSKPPTFAVYKGGKKIDSGKFEFG